MRALVVVIVIATITAFACESESPPPTQTESATVDANPVAPYRASIPFLTALPVGYRTEILLDTLSQPTSLAATRDSRLLITEQEAGRVRVFQDGTLQDESWLDLDVRYADDVFVGELGLVTIAIDPLFEENH